MPVGTASTALFLVASDTNDPESSSSSSNHPYHLHKGDGKVAHRRSFLKRANAMAAAATAAMTAVSFLPSNQQQAAWALVRGNPPPPPKAKLQQQQSSSTTEGGDPATAPAVKCTNVEECQALAELREQRERESAQANQIPVSVTKAGTRYRDLVAAPTDAGAAVVRDGDTVELYYKVLKLGKRSYDGISGEGTVVFSCGYGLEDNEIRPRDAVFVTTAGGIGNIAALNDGVLGMHVGDVRRMEVSVLCVAEAELKIVQLFALLDF
jgi:hypothetical protein